MNGVKTQSPVVTMASNDGDPLPLGWEVKIDPHTGWPFFVNHNNRTTTWSDPRHDTKKVRELSANGPNIPPEPSPPELQKSFVREMKHPVLRPGYVPIPVFHEGAELRQQQHPCYSYIHPTAAQSIRSEGRIPSPTPGLQARPRSPLHAASESSAPEPRKTSSPVSPTVEVYTAPQHQPPRPSSTGLQAGYIPIPVIHEGGGGPTVTQVQPNPSVYSQRVPYQEHQQPFHRLHSDEWPAYSPVKDRASPVMFPQHREAAAAHLPHHIRSQSPVVSQVLGERPQAHQHVIKREFPPKMEQEQHVPHQKPEVTQHTQPSHTDADSPKPQQILQPPQQQPQQLPLQQTCQQAQQHSPTLPQQPQQPQQPQEPQQPPPQPPTPPPLHHQDTEQHELPSEQEPEDTAAELPPVKVEAEQPAQTPVHPGLAKVQKIVERVAKLEQEVKCFDGKKNDKRYLLLEEMLTKELLALDSVDPEGRADVRQARRDGVRRVQTILEELEQMEEQQQTSGTLIQGGLLEQKGEPSMISKENVEIAKEIS